jgi:hypothetical protein
MRERLTARLQTLRDEYQSGQRMLADLDARREDLHQTLLRISGAIQVVEELLTAAEPGGSPAGAAALAEVQPG